MRPVGLLKTAALVGALMGIGCDSSTLAQSYSNPYPYEPPRYSQPTPPPYYDDQAPRYDDQPGGYYDEPAPPDLEGGQADVNDFYQNLAPHGQWVQTPQYGRCWKPAAVAADWRPYTLGRWIYTEDYGWYWLSDEPWGWATYHYGRWALLPGHGWIWVPGRTWGPAWVAWRSGGGYVGWAPLPPRQEFHFGLHSGGLDFAFHVSDHYVQQIPDACYTFVGERFVAEPYVHRHALPVARNVTVINRTTNITNIKVVNKKVVNRSLEVNHVERVAGRRIERVHVREAARPAEIRSLRANEVEVYRPRSVVRSSVDRHVTSAGHRPLAAPKPTPRPAPRAPSAPQVRPPAKPISPAVNRPTPRAAEPAKPLLSSPKKPTPAPKPALARPAAPSPRPLVRPPAPRPHAEPASRVQPRKQPAAPPAKPAAAPAKAPRKPPAARSAPPAKKAEERGKARGHDRLRQALNPFDR